MKNLTSGFSGREFSLSPNAVWSRDEDQLAFRQAAQLARIAQKVSRVETLDITIAVNWIEMFSSTSNLTNHLAEESRGTEIIWVLK